VGAYRDGILDRSFFVISMPKAKVIQPKTDDVSAPQNRPSYFGMPGSRHKATLPNQSMKPTQPWLSLVSLDR
jgi:hypothetical protein